MEKVNIKTPESVIFDNNKMWFENQSDIYSKLQPYFIGMDVATSILPDVTKALQNASAKALGGPAAKHVKLTNGEVVLLPDDSYEKVVGGVKGDPKADDVSAILPEGSFVLPKALRKNGRSLSDIFLDGEKYLDSLKKKMSKNPNTITQEEIDRVQAAHDLETETNKKLVMDYNMTRTFGEMIDNGFWGGGTVDDEAEKQAENDLLRLSNISLPGQEGNYETPQKSLLIQDPILNRMEESQSLITTGKLIPDYLQQGDKSIKLKNGTVSVTNNEAPVTAAEQYESFWNRAGNNLLDTVSGYTPGDWMGLAGAIYGTTFPLKDAYKNAALTKENPNFFENFGQDSLDTIDSAGNILKEQRDKMLYDVDQTENAIASEARSGARGVNQYTANRIAGHSLSLDKKADIENQFANSMLSYLQQKAATESSIDQVRMGAKAAQEDANRRDLEANQTNISKAKESTALGLQSIGKSMNAAKLNKDSYASLDEIYENLHDVNLSAQVVSNIQKELRKTYSAAQWEAMTKKQKEDAVKEASK